MMAMETLTATTLRNIIGDLELDQTLTSRDVINTKMRSILDEATDPWGIKVNRVELKNILPPQDIQNSMEKQMKADGEAQAIRTVQQALADSLGMLNEKAPSEQVIKLKSIEAMEKVADGKATKIIIPSQMQSLVGLANGLVEGVKEQ